MVKHKKRQNNIDDIKSKKVLYMTDAIATNNPNQKTKFKVDKNTYNNIVLDIKDTWPRWKLDLCNDDLLISVHSEKFM